MSEGNGESEHVSHPIFLRKCLYGISWVIESGKAFSIIFEHDQGILVEVDVLWDFWWNSMVEDLLEWRNWILLKLSFAKFKNY